MTAACPRWCTNHRDYTATWGNPTGEHTSRVGACQAFPDGHTRPKTLQVGTRQWEDSAGRDPRRIVVRLGRHGTPIELTAGQAEALAALLAKAAIAVRAGG